MIADACYLACDSIFDENFGWIKTGESFPTLYIATEQQLDEVQTMCLAFLSGVNEEKILYGRYENNEEERVLEAARVLSKSKLYIEVIPDFSLRDIEDCIKRNIRDHETVYCFYDYIHVSMKILEEITQRSGGVKMREDQILFLLASHLKDIAVDYNVFILSSTQLNAQYQDSETPDQNLLRGSKAIAD